MRQTGIICFLLFVLATSYYSLKYPAFNWDLLGYVASAVSYDENDTKEIHKITYNIVQASIPSGDFQKLISPKNAYLKKMHSDSEAFAQQLYVYRLKPLYVQLMYWLNRAGMPLVLSSIFISIISTVVICAITFVWLSKYIYNSWLGFACLFLGLVVRLPHISRLSTPDALSSALIITAFYLLLEKRKTLLGFSVLVLSVLARADNILLILLIGPALMYFSPKSYSLSKLPGSIIIFISLCVYFICSDLSGAHGWWYQFNHAFLGVFTGFNDIHIPFSIKKYFSVLLLGIIRIFYDPEFLSITPVFILLGTAIIYIPSINSESTIMYKRTALMMILYICTHFILFPVIDDRFFVTHNLMIFIGGIVVYCNSKPMRKKIVVNER